jgi:hypothetical protein
MENLTIVNGEIFATAPRYGAGVGSGIGEVGSASVDRLTILGGTITASSERAGAIGSGNTVTNGRSDVGVLTFSGRVRLSLVPNRELSAIAATSIVFSKTSIVAHVTGPPALNFTHAAVHSFGDRAHLTIWRGSLKLAVLGSQLPAKGLSFLPRDNPRIVSCGGCFRRLFAPWAHD